MNRRFLAAMAAYALLALLVGLTLGGAVRIGDREIDLRIAVWILLAGLAIKTWIAHKAGW